MTLSARLVVAMVALALASVAIIGINTYRHVEGLVLPRPNRTPPPTSVASILEHLFQHQIHHRGQAHAMLSSTRVKPPQLDEFFLAGEEHLRRDELRALGLTES